MLHVAISVVEEESVEDDTSGADLLTLELGLGLGLGFGCSSLERDDKKSSIWNEDSLLSLK